MSQCLNLNKLHVERKSPRDFATKYKSFLFKSFIEDFLRVGQKLQNITHTVYEGRGGNYGNFIKI